MLNGCDVNGAKGRIDWPAVARSGREFGITKATEGGDFVDARAAENMRDRRAAGMLGGCYHFARPSSGKGSVADAELEARHFLSVAGPLLHDDDVVVLDFEDERVPAGQDLRPWASRWLAVVEQDTGRVPLLYGFTSYLREHLLGLETLARFPLWLADYDGTYTVPSPWRALMIHQHTSSGTVPGIPGRADLNRFAGDRAAFRRLARPVRAPVPSTPTPTTPQEAIRMGYVHATLVPGMTAPWPGGRWTFYAVTPDGRLDVLNDLSQLGGHPSAFHFGDLRDKPLAGPVVQLVPTATGKGYWLVGADGGVYAFGDAPFFGSHGPEPEAGPVVGLVPLYGEVGLTPTGYVLLASDGGSFNYGTGRPPT